MSQFVYSDEGFSTATQAELDKAALKGGRWGGYFWGGYDLPQNDVQVRHGYGLALVNTQGCGNQGQLVLVPRSDRAAEYLHQGKVNLIMQDTGCTYQVADTYVSATSGVSFAFEADVYTLAIAERHSVGAWMDFDRIGRGYSVDQWCAQWSMPRLSYPRLCTVAHLALAIASA